MGLEILSSRAVIGMFYEILQQDAGVAWVDAISNYFESDQAGETYPWLGNVPMLREWVGGRQAKALAAYGITIPNLEFEATIEILVKHMRRDKTGQIRVRIGELVERSQSHWAKLISTLVLAGESQVCYDGQYFFDTDHSEGDSGTQSNSITTDISALPALVHGSAASVPSPEEMQQAILKSINQIITFKDDQAEPMNETASRFLVMVPTGLNFIAQAALSMPRGTVATEQSASNMQITLAHNGRLNWTDKFATFRIDGRVKPFIRQEEYGVQIKAKAEGSEYEFDNKAHQYGIDTSRNAGYGRWQYACLNQLV